jgi:hypothetical protein
LGVYFLGDRMSEIVILILALFFQFLCFAAFVIQKNYAAAAWVLVAAIWVIAWYTK